MSLRTLNILLFIALVATVGLNWVAGRDLSRPNVEFLPEMVHSVPYDAFDPSPVFADGKTLQQPVEGTIVRGSQPIHYAATPEDALRAGRELVNPYAPDAQDARDAGASVYSAFCQHCHGAQGAGDGPVSKRGFPPPPALSTPKADSMSDGQMFHILTYGQGNMPSHAPQLVPDDRWKVILHVRTLQARAARKAAAEEIAAAKAAEEAAAVADTANGNPQ